MTVRVSHLLRPREGRRRTHAISSELMMSLECAARKSPSSLASIAASLPNAGVTLRRIHAVAMYDAKRPIEPRPPMDRPSWMLNRMRSSEGLETFEYRALSVSQKRLTSVVTCCAGTSQRGKTGEGSDPAHKLVSSACADARVQVNDLVERVVLVEVQVVDVAREAGSERDGELRLEEANHGVGVDRRHCEEEPVAQALQEALAIGRDLHGGGGGASVLHLLEKRADKQGRTRSPTSLPSS